MDRANEKGLPVSIYNRSGELLYDNSRLQDKHKQAGQSLQHSREIEGQKEQTLVNRLAGWSIALHLYEKTEKAKDENYHKGETYADEAIDTVVSHENSKSLIQQALHHEKFDELNTEESSAIKCDLKEKIASFQLQRDKQQDKGKLTEAEKFQKQIKDHLDKSNFSQEKKQKILDRAKERFSEIQREKAQPKASLKRKRC